MVVEFCGIERKEGGLESLEFVFVYLGKRVWSCECFLFGDVVCGRFFMVGMYSLILKMLEDLILDFGYGVGDLCCLFSFLFFKFNL